MDAPEAMDRLSEARARGLAAIEAASSLEDLRTAEVASLGRKAPVSEVQRSLGALDPADRPAVGQAVNRLFEELRDAVAARREGLEAEAEAGVAESDRIDVTLPGRRPPPGGLHPLASTLRRVVDAFVSLGYRVSEGPEIETEWYNFDALNFPPDHPARLTQDTLYPDVPGDLLLRTHTSPVQIRTMETTEPPIYVVIPGRCYRRDTPDATHLPVFQQVEILAVDEGLTL
ncbi:MAG: phenylalanine--tRNA ligase subunit alpha, partial [Actinomycetota bacterium]